MGQAIDAQDASGAAAVAAEIKATGIESVGMYYFRTSGNKTLLTAEVVGKVSAAGLLILSLYENGWPNKASYFTESPVDIGNLDAHTAGIRALDAGQPTGTPIYFSVDFDAETVELGAITAYFTEVCRVLALLKPSYTAGVYGSGMVCQHLSALGLVSHTWLSQSKDFHGYDAWEPKADVVQGKETITFGLDIDPDETRGNAGAWSSGS